VNPSKKARKKVAEANQAARDRRTPQEQLRVLDERAPRGAKKERARLNKLIADRFKK
jgi:hypothetical protein